MPATPAAPSTPARGPAPPRPRRRARRVRPLEAWRAMRALLADPDDTARVFDIIDALSGRTRDRVFRRFLRTPGAERLLAERPRLLDHLADREALLALPEGSLGRAYAEFTAREQISPDGLVAASAEGGRGPDPDASPEQRWFGERLRDQHDLWHVVTGYGRDLLGEGALLAFTHAQTRNPGIGFIVAVAWWRAGEAPAIRRLFREAHRRGRRAAWLPAQPWEALLPRPLEAVRRELGVGAPVRYEPLRSSGAPPLESGAGLAG